MCTLAAYVRVTAEVPLLVAANRDEFLDRPSAAPALIAHDPWVFAGQDLSAGGTWFGVNEHGMVVGLLNRRQPEGPDPARRSRGLLCLETLQTRSPAEAAQRLRGVDAAAYNSFNLLVADAREAFVATAPFPAALPRRHGLHEPGARVQITPLPSGVHLLTNAELNDPTCPRIAKSSELFRAFTPPSAAAIECAVPALCVILSDHATALDPRASTIDTLCVHRDGYGTRSSSIVAVTAAGTMRYWHAAGPPCRSAYEELSLPRVG
jgi:uncharacterized protein with NRDE domain